MKKRYAIGACLALVSCGSMGGNSASAPIAHATPSLAGEPFDQVLLRVKQEVGLFQAESATWHAGLQDEFKRLGIVPRCGNGDINFNVTSVKMEFATTLDQTESGQLGLKIPFGPAGIGNVGPGIKGSSENKGTSTLDYTYYVPASPSPLDPIAEKNIASSAVIAPTLAALRDGLVRATAQLPCMSDTPKDKDDTFTFAVELTHDTNPTIGFNFAILSASAGFDTSNKRANTITVTFHPTPTAGKMLKVK